MKTIIVNKKITIEAKFLYRNVLDHAKRIINGTLIDECTQEYGYVISVQSISKVNGFKIFTPTSKCVLDIDVELETIKPEIDNILTGEICMISNVGIFLTIKNKLQVLIPSSKTCGYKNNTINTKITKGSESYSIGDLLSTCITGFEYSNGKFSACGSLVEIKNNYK